MTPQFAHPDAVPWALALIRRFEACCLSPQPDTGDRWQIGWGQNYLLDGSPVTEDTPPIDQPTADAWLLERLAGTYAAETDALIADAAVNDRQRGALYSFAWNEGEGALRDSTLLRYVQFGRMDLAAEQFSAWVYADGRKLNGLVTRRAVERAVFEGRITLAQVPTWEPAG